MLKTGILNPQIANVFASTGHKDFVVVSDAGLPMPSGIERTDLAWKPNEPKYLDVLEETLKHIVVEKVILIALQKVVLQLLRDFSLQVPVLELAGSISNIGSLS